MAVLQELERTERVEANPAYKASLELLRAQCEAQRKSQTHQYRVILCFAGLGLGLTALVILMTPYLLALTGFPLLGGFIAQLFRVHKRGEEKLAKVEAKLSNLQLQSDQIALEQERIERGLLRNTALDFQSGERLIALVDGREPDSPEGVDEPPPDPDLQPTLPFKPKPPGKR